MTGLVSFLFILAQTFITLDQALEIALSENVAVKVADKEIEASMPSVVRTHRFFLRSMVLPLSREL